MKKPKNFYFKLFTSLSIIPTLGSIAITTSCLSDHFYAKTDIASINKTFPKELREKITKLVESDSKIKEMVHSQRIIQITAAGRINDNSFNQLSWEAISEFSNNVKTNQSSYKQTSVVSSAEIYKAYTNALLKNYNVWVLIGWQHERFLDSWLKNPINKKTFEEKQIKVISVDWDVSKIVAPGTGLSLTFRTQESSFLIGYSVAQFLAELYPGLDNQNKRFVSTTAGTDTSGSTNFNYGFLEGIRAWNKEQSNNDNKVSVLTYKENQRVFLNTTYTPDNLATKSDFRLSVTGEGGQIYKGPKPSIVMPVAGDWSRTAANIIKETNNTNEQWVVGVDSNMAISYGDTYKNYFISSSEKRIGIAVYKALCFLTGISSKIKELNENPNQPNPNDILFPNQNETNWTVINNEGKIGKIHQGQDVKNQVVVGGIELGFVGASPSLIQNETHAKRFDEIIKSTQDKFFGQNGQLTTDLETNKNVEMYKTIKAELEQNKNEENRKKYNDIVFQLANILLGEMNESNNHYFNLVVEEINKR